MQLDFACFALRSHFACCVRVCQNRRHITSSFLVVSINKTLLNHMVFALFMSNPGLSSYVKSTLLTVLLYVCPVFRTVFRLFVIIKDRYYFYLFSIVGSRFSF